MEEFWATVQFLDSLRMTWFLLGVLVGWLWWRLPSVVS